MDQKQSDVLTLIHLIKSESEKTRKDLSESFETKMAEGFAKQKSELRKDMRQGFENQKKELISYLDDKFEDHRRKIVDEIQSFEDHILKDNLAINQELLVNSARLTKVEKHIFSN